MDNLALVSPNRIAFISPQFIIPDDKPRRQPADERRARCRASESLGRVEVVRQLEWVWGPGALSSCTLSQLDGALANLVVVAAN